MKKLLVALIFTFTMATHVSAYNFDVKTVYGYVCEASYTYSNGLLVKAVYGVYDYMTQDGNYSCLNGRIVIYSSAGINKANDLKSTNDILKSILEDYQNHYIQLGTNVQVTDDADGVHQYFVKPFSTYVPPLTQQPVPTHGTGDGAIPCYVQLDMIPF